ncbi:MULTISPECIES: sirohydrochlorin chelatase [Tsukamurella]|uniref:Sirohydrochlorin chelatase n=2 Tax=Tsukamurella TaxID=2060 RepID=A0A5C5RZ95_9ACTN|nr:MULTISPECIES: CbiX/SirB N-terminal domain-containing protein [Tsukamurella]NMD54525.1 sirohydrochlorin chelatase [Tsukamurella columbiensis]TWS28447.1 sirohydrochlorin chelatase [Tsukamurella conjunctivitidis]
MAALSGGPAERRVLVAHGTRSNTGIATVRAIADAVALRTGPVEVAFVDVRGPSPSDLLRGDDRPTVLVPAFLAAGYHVRTDVPRHVAVSGRTAVSVTAALGPDRALVGALLRRLREAGWRPGDDVVLGATGSSDPDARADVRAMARHLADALGRPVPVGFLAAGTPTVADALAATRVPGRRVFLAAYQLAEGLFHTRLVEAGADGAAAPLGTAPEVIDLLVERFAQSR